jgi:ABC-type lipoprotein export system ATPase subunit
MAKKSSGSPTKSIAALDEAPENQIIRTLKIYREQGNIVLFIARSKTMSDYSDKVCLTIDQRLIPVPKSTF